MDLHGVDPKIWVLWLLSPFIVSAALWFGVAIIIGAAHTVSFFGRIVKPPLR